jgi:NAD(P)-dependent dehydrogenase (short-subunit alcohol dehydrogenase family)
VVAGATRGAGRGIATALGEAGATVICTGRSTRSRGSEYDRPETIEDTAELVTHLGGVGVAVAVDHLDAEQVHALADQIRDQYGHIDVLVNARRELAVLIDVCGESRFADLQDVPPDVRL